MLCLTVSNLCSTYDMRLGDFLHLGEELVMFGSRNGEMIDALVLGHVCSFSYDRYGMGCLSCSPLAFELLGCLTGRVFALLVRSVGTTQESGIIFAADITSSDNIIQINIYNSFM